MTELNEHNCAGRGLVEKTRADTKTALRFMAANLAAGVGFGLALCAAIVSGLITNIGPLVRTVDGGAIAVVMLAAGFIITWGSAAVGTALFLAARGPSGANGLGQPRDDKRSDRRARRTPNTRRRR